MGAAENFPRKTLYFQTSELCFEPTRLSLVMFLLLYTKSLLRKNHMVPQRNSHHSHWIANYLILPCFRVEYNRPVFCTESKEKKLRSLPNTWICFYHYIYQKIHNSTPTLTLLRIEEIKTRQNKVFVFNCCYKVYFVKVTVFQVIEFLWRKCLL